MEEDFESHVVPMMEKYADRFGDVPLQLEDFHNAASLVSSRAFFVNKHHGSISALYSALLDHPCCL